MLEQPTQLQIRIIDATGELYAGQVIAISSVNEDGPFDILPEHTNFISLISQSLVLHLPDGKKQNISVDSGVLRCFSSSVEVYLGVGKY